MIDKYSLLYKVRRDNRGSAPINSRLTGLVEYEAFYQDQNKKNTKTEVATPSGSQLTSMGVDNCNLFLFLLDSGCRVSEALGITLKQLTPIGTVKIKGSKGSEDRLVNTMFSRSYFIACYNDKRTPFSDTNYMSFYRCLVKYGVGARFGTNDKMSVTHYFRHIRTLMGLEAGFSLEDMQRYLGHKNIKSTQSYAKKKR